MGPWNIIGHEVGKAIGRKVKHDVAAAEFPWSHSEKIQELATDAGLSPSYLKDLITNSTSKEHFTALLQYLQEPAKAGNLSPELRESMVRVVKNRLELIIDHEVLQVLIRFMRERADSVADIADLFG